ncbi:RNA-binding protein [Pseudoalteromonas sp. YIC-656]|uniref:RNA recognition motif domain-containing protein n=1 Tax=Pseudoalteromonas pernae TaxID=3118054 RepID=UPI003242EB4D
MKLLVRNLERTTSEHDIRALFSTHGTVTECNLVLDQLTGLSKGFAFVEMPDENEAKSAVEKLNMAVVDKSKIRVKIAQN